MPAAAAPVAPSPAAPGIDLSSLLTSWGLQPSADASPALQGVLGGVLDAARDYAIVRKPRPSKDFTVPASIPITYDQVSSKDFWNTLGSIASTVVPFIFQLASGTDASGKEYQPVGQAEAQQRILALLQPHANDKDFLDALGATMPQILDLLNQVLGGKDYVPPQKDFFSDIGNALSNVNWGQVLSTGVQIAGMVGPLLA